MILRSLVRPGRRFLGPLYWRAVRPCFEWLSARAAALYRLRRGDVVWVGVTGSAAKSTTKDLISAVLSTRLKGSVTGWTGNYPHDVARNILGISRNDGFRVVEVGANSGPGSLDAPLALLRPRIGVVTTIGTDHYRAFGSIDAIAAEKAKMVRLLPADGVAVLNADDPRVLAMRENLACRVLTFGFDPGADVRAESVTAAWPDRLAFTLVHAGRSVAVQTQLCGAHWVSAALAAVTVGIAVGISVEDAARAIGQVPPFQGRMYPMTLPDGVIVIRDDWKASLSSIPPVIEFLRHARAPRKILVMGTISDHFGEDKINATTAREAREVADLVCFVGARAFGALRAKTHPNDDSIRGFGTVKAATDFLRAALRPGDLVLLKGSNTADHLYRVILARTRSVACWQEACGRMAFCDQCALVEVASEPASGEVSIPLIAADVSTATPAPPVTASVREPATHIFVGLGNPGEEYQSTPHNVGHAALDRLATTLGARWEPDGDADVARAEWQGTSVCLLKPKAWMNHSGPALRELAERLGFEPPQCVLVYDDLDLPLGTVRVRMRGSDGGHRGVRSILEAFQTDQFRRVKVGVARPGAKRPARDEVLTPFTPDEWAIVHSACAEVIERAGELVKNRPGPPSAGSPISSS